MAERSEKSAEQKQQLHPRNKHRSRYDFPKLIAGSPELAPYVSQNQYQDLSIDFKDSDAVKALNKALLNDCYRISLWDIPDGYLCPPIPGRVDYIHYMADLLATANNGTIPRGKQVKVLDIGVGANCIYPLIGHREYGWTFVGSDVDRYAVQNAKTIVQANGLAKAVTIRKQNADHIFAEIIQTGERFDLTICNPPFHTSLQEAMAGTERKWRNLAKTPVADNALNFGGKNAELWCKGGEEAFVLQMIQESVAFAGSCLWFTSLISKKDNLPNLYFELTKANAAEVRTINMAQGQKISRVLAWTFMDEAARQAWYTKV